MWMDGDKIERQSSPLKHLSAFKSRFRDLFATASSNPEPQTELKHIEAMQAAMI